MGLLDFFRHREVTVEEAVPEGDPMRDLIRETVEQNDESWDEINESRKRRGKSPIVPEDTSSVARSLISARDRTVHV